MTPTTNNIPRRATRAARLARHGLGFAPQEGLATDASKAAGSVLDELRQKLDAIKADELATPKERRAASAAATKAASADWQRVRIKIDAAAARLAEQVENLDAIAWQVEAKVGPVGVLRIQQRAADLRRLDPRALAEADAAAKRRGDHEHALARGLIAATAGDEGRRLLLATIRPEAFEKARSDAAAVRALLHRASIAERGIAELAAIDDAFDLHGDAGGDLMELANEEPEPLPAALPGWIR